MSRFQIILLKLWWSQSLELMDNENNETFAMNAQMMVSCLCVLAMKLFGRSQLFLSVIALEVLY
jgi:hypothetical protein